jgi:hypothetical protein
LLLHHPAFLWAGREYCCEMSEWLILTMPLYASWQRLDSSRRHGRMHPLYANPRCRARRSEERRSGQQLWILLVGFIDSSVSTDIMIVEPLAFFYYMTSTWWEEEEKPATSPPPDFKYVPRIPYFLSKQTCVNKITLHFTFFYFYVCPSKKLCLRLNQCLRRLWDKYALLSSLQIWWFVTWAAVQVTTHSSSSLRWSRQVGAIIWWGSNSSSMTYEAMTLTISSNQLNSSTTQLQHIIREKTVAILYCWVIWVLLH